mmetsp:Transcript_56687/g.179152  ORF Transcript_56687/g.179152 Transcript_56687/m.179152 type:complete len:209 (+) Transcript_56687:562-1188(+)
MRSPPALRASACSRGGAMPSKRTHLSSLVWHLHSHSRKRRSMLRSLGTAPSSSAGRLSRKLSLLRVTRKEGPKKSAPRSREKTASGSSSWPLAPRLARTFSTKGTLPTIVSGMRRPCQKDSKMGASRRPSSVGASLAPDSRGSSRGACVGSCVQVTSISSSSSGPAGPSAPGTVSLSYSNGKYQSNASTTPWSLTSSWKESSARCARR